MSCPLDANPHRGGSGAARRQEAPAMAYDDSRFRGEPGFREEPDFRVPEDAPTLDRSPASSIYSPGAYPVNDYGPAPESPRRTTPSAAQLTDVFDDPEHGDPGRDRMT